MEAHGTGVEYAYDRVKQAVRLHSDRGEALRQAILACRKGGTLSILGVYGVMDKFPLGVIMNKGLTVKTAQQHGHKYLPRLLEHAARGELDPSFLITHRLPLEQSPQGYELFKNKEDGCVRAVFAP
jgi:threonine dehydrogenase-like Zn-dependent dehydrogenase